jgi:hypothetical protein
MLNGGLCSARTTLPAWQYAAPYELVPIMLCMLRCLQGDVLCAVVLRSSMRQCMVPRWLITCYAVHAAQGDVLCAEVLWSSMRQGVVAGGASRLLACLIHKVVPLAATHSMVRRWVCTYMCAALWAVACFLLRTAYA